MCQVQQTKQESKQTKIPAIMRTNKQMSQIQSILKYNRYKEK